MNSIFDNFHFHCRKIIKCVVIKKVLFQNARFLAQSIIIKGHTVNSYSLQAIINNDFIDWKLVHTKLFSKG